MMAILIIGTSLGLAGTDLVLPAVPTLPELLGGSAQYVLAAYVAGAGIGLALFGALGARFNQTSLLVISLVGFGVLSLVIAAADTLVHVITLRFFQGLSGCAAAVFAPGIIRALYDQTGAVRALGLLGSIEGLVPALAPLLGLWLLSHCGWTASFYLTGLFALGLALIAATGVHTAVPAIEPPGSSSQVSGYVHLIRNLHFVRYARGQVLCLGALVLSR